MRDVLRCIDFISVHFITASREKKEMGEFLFGEVFSHSVFCVEYAALHYKDCFQSIFVISLKIFRPLHLFLLVCILFLS